jgi:nickel-type superoxide dismutase maturation protease
MRHTERSLGDTEDMGEDLHRVSLVIVVYSASTRVRLVVVDGESMCPTLEPGDRVLVLSLRARVGDVIALRDPRRPERIIVKRVHAIVEGALDVRGDNEAASTDSRTFGVVAPRAVLGRVVYRYAPAARAGRVRRYG